MTSLNDILTAAQALDPAERAQLLTALWQASSPAEWLPPSAEWIAECNRRSDAHDAGKMTDSSWEEVRERARRKAGLDD